MMKQSESDEQYKLVGQEALMWLEKAQGLRFCAGILKDQLVEMVTNNDTPPWALRVETNGVVSSTLLLLGLAFENLIKGVDIARDPSLVNLKSLNLRLWKGDGGHAIRNFAKSLMKLEPDEEELLDRLQESIFWAGRFPIPLNSVRYHESHNPVSKHQLSTADFATADRLFDRLKEQLIKFRDSHTK
jgi:hypothetical protein